MTDNTHYHILFKGEALDGQNLDQVKAHFAKLFKADENKLNQLFSGKVVALKRDLAKPEAAKFQQLFKKAGAKVYIKAVDASPAQVSSAASVNTGTDSTSNNAKIEQAAQGDEKAQSSKQESTAESNLSSTPDQNQEQPSSTYSDEPYQKPDLKPVDMAAVNFDLSPAGADLLLESEKTTAEAVDVDISDISLAEAGAILETLHTDEPKLNPNTDHLSTAELGSTLSDAATQELPEIQISTDHISVAEAGSDLQDFIDDIPDFPPDVAHLSIAPAGSDLETLKSEETPLKPDISHIQLEDE